MQTRALASANMIIMAHRLPVRRVEDDDGLRWGTSPGGLVSALTPAMSDRSGLAWIGWPGSLADELTKPFQVDGLNLLPITLSREEKELHYDGMSNGTLWPLYHDKVAPVDFHRTWFDGYKRINQRFADAALQIAAHGATVWIHDYQLQLVPAMLRKARPDLKIGFFLHIPFPPEELFVQLPWRSELTHGLLGADLIGFQTPDAVANFSRLAAALNEAERESKYLLKVNDSTNGTNLPRNVTLKSFPIGIDASRYDSGAKTAATRNAALDLRQSLGNPKVIMLGVDRLDYTKGIDVRLRAFKELLAEGRVNPSEVTMIQVAEPSRDKVDAYVSLRERVERLVGEINGDYGRVGFPVVHYLHQSQAFENIMALYRAADVMLVTPLRDGMNLVAKEYVATRFDNSGVLILSEFAGASHQLKDALLVNPHDIAGMKNALVKAVEISEAETQQRMRSLRRVVKRRDATSWAKNFLDALENAGPKQFPQ